MRRWTILSAAGAAVILTASAVALPGCEGVFWESCTLIGCTEGVTFEISGAASSSLRLEAVAEDGTTRVHSCEVVAGECTIAFEYFTPDAFTLTMTGSDDYLALELTPAYEVVQPNGPSCDPACRVATIHVALAPPNAVDGAPQ